MSVYEGIYRELNEIRDFLYESENGHLVNIINSIQNELNRLYSVESAARAQEEYLESIRPRNELAKRLLPHVYGTVFYQSLDQKKETINIILEWAELFLKQSGERKRILAPEEFFLIYERNEKAKLDFIDEYSSKDITGSIEAFLKNTLGPGEYHVRKRLSNGELIDFGHIRISEKK